MNLNCELDQILNMMSGKNMSDSIEKTYFKKYTSGWGCYFNHNKVHLKRYCADFGDL